MYDIAQDLLDSFRATPAILRGLLALAFALILIAAGCGGDDAASVRSLTIVVNAPFSKTPYVGETIARGEGRLRCGSPFFVPVPFRDS